MHGDWTPEAGYQAGVALLASGLPDAVFAGNDGMALGLLSSFRQHGVSVPGDVSVVGFDDVEGAAFFDPPLTTVRQDFLALGALALNRLLELISGDPSTKPARQKIQPELVVRQSSAKHRPTRLRQFGR
jgi:DNA-binding LacI/PurR family transcriptional regulator